MTRADADADAAANKKKAGPDGSDKGGSAGEMRRLNVQFCERLPLLGKRTRAEFVSDDESDEYWQEVTTLARWGMKYSRMTQHIEKRLDHMLRGTCLRLNVDTPPCSDADHFSAVDRREEDDEEDDADDDDNDDDDDKDDNDD